MSGRHHLYLVDDDLDVNVDARGIITRLVWIHGLNEVNLSPIIAQLIDRLNLYHVYNNAVNMRNYLDMVSLIGTREVNPLSHKRNDVQLQLKKRRRSKNT